ncbi:MAG: ABC transporter substrate-binding protein [Clostridiales bacterium]|nr:ABC transporter substrate-binding protein [Clostridiales bacterium]
MKKFLILLLSLLLSVGLFACTNGDVTPGDDTPEGSTPGNNEVIEIYLPDGAPALSLVSLFDKTEIGGQTVKFIVVPSSNIAAYLMNGKADLAIVPTNAAAIIYNRDNPYKYVSANTHGNLFMVGLDDADSLEDLKGKVVGVIGQGQVPDLIFRTLLGDAGIEYEVGDKPVDGKVSLYYAQDGGTLLPLIKTGKVNYGVLGEPAVTTALSNIEGSKVIFDIQQLWGEGYPQAGLMAKNSVSDDFLKALFDELEQNESYAEQNPGEAKERIAAHMIESSETTVKVLTADTVKRCNVRLVKAEDCKDDVIAFLTAFYNLEPSSIGGKLPDADFFRIVK